ncbi:MAG: hypothetical protein KDD11_08915 [Acidobacteria bacterium]|nr:hypothetical protein [Acidobacteriota bacterium]MCB1055616.1 hypothetical protein [Acidobacteriota bacterium]
MRPIALLGPQRHQPIVSKVVDRLAGSGPLAVVTAGWQEREEELDELAQHVRRPVTNLLLHARAEQFFIEEPELFEALRDRQNLLKQLQQLHRLRLDFVLEPARKLLHRKSSSPMLEEEQASAIAAVRALDDHHAEQLKRQHDAFEARWGEALDEALAGHRRELAEILDGSAALAIAGGHVAVLLNRLRLFRVLDLLGDQPIIAWSAGAMALAERVVLFHDRPPQGAGNAEILDLGLGIAHGIQPLPHAEARLQLDDPVRVSLLARRLAPAACIALDTGSSIFWDGDSWTAGPGTRQLQRTGEVEVLEAVA